MSKAKHISIICLGVLFFSAGILHFLMLDFFSSIVPPVLPWPEGIVIATGVFELVLGPMLILSRHQQSLKFWGYAAVAYTVAVTPANIYHALINVDHPVAPMEPGWLWLRVALQLPLLLWIIWACRPEPQSQT